MKTLSKQGSISVEAAIICPVMIFVIVCFIGRLNMLSAETLLYEIIDEESRKASVTNVIAEYINDIAEERGPGQLTEYFTDMIFDMTQLTLLENQISYEICKAAGINEVFRKTINIQHISAEKNIAETTMFVRCDYIVVTPLMKIKKSHTIPVALWESRRTYPDIKDENQGVDIWNKNNFERGLYFRKRFGGNLPIGYPVISGFSNGVVLSIRSINLNSSTWADTADVYDELKSEIDELAGFRGSSEPWGRDQINIASKDITDRVLKIIIPGNIDTAKYKIVMDKLVQYGKVLSVNTIFIHYG